MTKKSSSAATRFAFAAGRLWILAAIVAAILVFGIQPGAIAREIAEANPTTASEREAAGRELQLAQEGVEKARLASASAKIQLDEFIARHFDEHLRQGTAPVPQFRESKPAGKITVNPRWQHLNDQLAELKTRREELLTRLMPVHPDVVEIDDRIAVLSREFALERPSTEEPSSPGATDEVNPGDGNLAEYLSAERQRHRQSASAYAEILARWHAAESDLHAAIEGERQAARRLADLQAPAAPIEAMPSPVPATAPAPQLTALPMAAPEPSARVAKTSHSSSQPLALAVLLIALAVAALAAVKLARSSTDAVFANAADVSSVLALPVVGVIPAADMDGFELHPASRIRRATRLLAEILLALLVFVTVATLVQNPSSIWQICTDPMDGLSQLARFFRTN